MDFSGTALLITAITGGIAVIVPCVTAAVLSILTFRRAGRAIAAAEAAQGTAKQATDELAKVHILVNGQSQRLEKALTSGAFAQGEKAGAAEERERTAVAGVASALGNGPKGGAPVAVEDEKVHDAVRALGAQQETVKSAVVALDKRVETEAKKDK